MNNELCNLKMTRKQKKEVITDTLNNLDYLEIRRLLINLIESTATSNKAYEYLLKEHEQKLIDSLMCNEIIKEE